MHLHLGNMSKQFTLDTTGSSVLPGSTFATDLAILDHSISVGEAKDMIIAFSASDIGRHPLHETFNAQAINRLLDAPGVIGLRIYNGTDINGNICFVLA